MIVPFTTLPSNDHVRSLSFSIMSMKTPHFAGSKIPASADHVNKQTQTFITSRFYKQTDKWYTAFPENMFFFKIGKVRKNCPPKIKKKKKKEERSSILENHQGVRLMSVAGGWRCRQCCVPHLSCQRK